LGGTVSAAETLTEKTFINAWLEILEFDENLSFSEWISNIAVSAALGELKAKKSSLPDNNQVMPADSGTDIIDSELLKLPDNERCAFVLHEIEKYSYEKISEFLGIPVNESKQLTWNARLKLIQTIK
jgi:DNA-directed RNA polymerase specialized sigma24 family protein